MFVLHYLTSVFTNVVMSVSEVAEAAVAGRFPDCMFIFRPHYGVGFRVEVFWEPGIESDA